MVWEIKVCRKYIKILMSSSKTSVFPATKREAVTNCSDLGVSRERKGGDKHAAWAWVRGNAVLASQRGGGLVSACGLLALGAWCVPGSHVTLCLHCAGHVPSAGK